MVASIGTVNASWTGRGTKGKTANDTAFKTLDADAQAALKEAVGGRAYNSAKKISASLNADGVKTVVGESHGETYIDITNKNGSKTRIWDVGGDSGIGTQDLSFTDAVNSVGNDLAKSVNQTNTDATLVNQITSTDNQDSVADKNLFSNTDNKTTNKNTTSDAEKAAEEQKLLNRIAADLMKQYNISEEEALKKAPDYVSLYTANSIA